MTAEKIRELYDHQVRLFRSLTPKHPGTNCLKYAGKIRAFVSQNNVHTLLDYGSGAGEQYNEQNQFHKLINVPREDIDLYDIGIRSYDKLPNNIYDCVLAVDVFNYIPETLFEYEFNRLYSRTRSVFAVVNLRPTDPLAVTRRSSAEWWDDVFNSFSQPTTVVFNKSSYIKDADIRMYRGGSRIG